MSEIASFKQIIELWGDSREAMAADVGSDAVRVSKWWQRDRIPAVAWSAVIGSRKGRENGLTADLLLSLEPGKFSNDKLREMAADEARA